MKIHKYILIVLACLLVSILTIFHVIVGFFKTPAGAIYLGTGHYYLDYFYYLTPIAQAQRGEWMSFQQVAIGDPSRYPHLWPYILFGKLGSLFSLSPAATYWTAVFILAFLLGLLIFLSIKKLLPEQNFPTQFLAFFLVIFSAPFVNYDFWYSTSTFFRRFEPIPHHLLTSVFILLAFLSFNRFIEKKILRFGVLTIILLTLVLTFNSYNVVTPTVALLFTGIWLARKQTVSVIIFFLLLGLSLGLTAFGLKNFYSQTTFLAGFKSTEIALHQEPGIKLLLLSIGPIILLAPFGIFKFLQKLSAARVIFFALFLASYILYLSPLDRIIGTHNGRFLSPLSLVFFGVLGVLGIMQTSSFSKRWNKLVTVVIVILILSSFLPPTLQSLSNSLNDRNIFSPITYLPSGIVAGFRELDKLPKKGNVLVTPSQFLGTVVPVYSGRKNYVARHIVTPNYLEKNITAGNFYLGAMSQEQALDFLNKNDIAYVVLTSIEGYDKAPLYKYTFLQEVYRNQDTLIFEVIENKLSYGVR